MTITTEIIETKLDEEEELYIGEEEEEPTERIANGASKWCWYCYMHWVFWYVSHLLYILYPAESLVADGKYVVPKGVVVEELKNYSGESLIFISAFCVAMCFSIVCIPYIL